MIKVFEPRLTLSDKFSVLKTLFENNISGTSPVVEKFERKLATEFDRKHSISVANGSVALDLAFQALDLQDGDEVIVPSFTIISCLSAILRTKATPVFCDVDEKTWNMSLNNVKDKFSNKTRVVLMVHTYGLTADAIKISEFCKDNNIILVEDSAESHGQTVDGTKCGSFGLISTLSFYSNKHITTGEGGALLTDSNLIKEKIIQMRNLDFTNKERFNHENLYWNYRIGGMQAALGISQIDQMSSVIENKIKQGKYYLKLFENYGDKVNLPLLNSDQSINNFWVFGITLKKTEIRDKVIESLLKNNIETRPFFWPLHLQKYLLTKTNYVPESLPVSEKLGRDGLYIPIGSHINKKTQQEIAKTLIEVINKY